MSFKVEITKKDWGNPDEKNCSITHNGRQWMTVRLTKKQAIKLIKALIRSFKIEEFKS